MDLVLVEKNALKEKLIFLMDTVAQQLDSEPNVDKFLDETYLFDEWEKALSEAEYPIFVMAVLNNSRRDPIINTIIDSIVNQGKTPKINENFRSKNKSLKSHVGEHPFS